MIDGDGDRGLESIVFNIIYRKSGNGNIVVISPETIKETMKF
jgi:hypothetical protein